MTTPATLRAAYTPPKSAVGAFFWRKRIWMETTFATSLLEPWEKFILFSVFGLLCVLLSAGIYKYLPQNLMLMQQRATYYLWGQEGDERLLSHWLGVNRGLRKEL